MIAVFYTKLVNGFQLCSTGKFAVFSIGFQVGKAIFSIYSTDKL